MLLTSSGCHRNTGMLSCVLTSQNFDNLQKAESFLFQQGEVFLLHKNIHIQPSRDSSVGRAFGLPDLTLISHCGFESHQCLMVQVHGRDGFAAMLATNRSELQIRAEGRCHRPTVEIYNSHLKANQESQN